MMKNQNQNQNQNQTKTSVQVETQPYANHRRVFMMQALVGCAVVGTVLQAKAQTMLAETDAQAIALGYKADATKVDKTKQPKYVAGQVCTNCALFKGAANAAAGGCPLFGAKQVAGKGWCSAWVKKG
jgi:hypothetical protein